MEYDIATVEFRGDLTFVVPQPSGVVYVNKFEQPELYAKIWNEFMNYRATLRSQNENLAGIEV